MRKLISEKQLKAATLVAASALLFLAACTKPRDQRIADEGMQLQLIAKSELNGLFTVTYGAPAGISSAVLSGISEKPVVSVASANVPSLLRRFFTEVPMKAKPASISRIAFVIKGQHIFVLRSIAADEKVSAREAGLVETPLEDRSIRMLPMFAIKIKESGVLIPRKNDNGEQTTNLELRATDISVATHLQIDTKIESVIPVGISPRTLQADKSRLVAPEDILSKVTNKADLEAQLGPNAKIPGSHLQVDSKLTVRLIQNGQSSGVVNLIVYSIRKKSEVDREYLEILESGTESAAIRKCSAEEKAQLAADFANDCYLQAEVAFGASNVRAELEKEVSGATPNVVSVLTPLINGKPSLLEISTDPVMTSQTPVSADKNLLPVSAFREKEYFFRRTFKSAASTLMAFGPGASGPIELIKFELEPNRVVVRRVLSVNGDQNPGVIDREELMSIPARYFQTRDRAGNLLAIPKEVGAANADSVQINWLNNTIPIGNSPLAFFQAGQCFHTVGNQEVKDFDQRLEAGILNFSIRGTYTFRPGCMSVFGMNDYWYQGGVQTTYNLEERVSFMVNDGALDKKQNQDVAFRAAHMMGFGAFTQGRKILDPLSGNPNQITAEVANPVVHDFSNGKVLTYILAGLPEDATYKDLVIRGTQLAVDDWNEALHKAFAGTSLARSGKYIELKVEGIDAPVGQLGDLDKSYIYNYNKKLDSGLLGMSQAAPHPRNGYIVTNNVLMYSGNLLGYVIREKEMAQIQAQYEAMKQMVLTTAPVQSEDGLSSGGSALQGGDRRPSTGSVQNILQKSQVFKPMTPASVVGGASTLKQKYSSVQAVMGSVPRTEEVRDELNKRSYLNRIVERAIEMNAMHDPLTLEALSAAEVLKAYGSQLSAQQKELLALQSRHMALRAEFSKGMGKGPNCFMVVQPGNGAPDLLKTPTEDIFFNWYAATLSHEIGHSLGLTHNFVGSTDKANWEFAGEKTGRDYSSIMDYVHPFHENYRKPGPYDVHAIRAAYTGLIEVHDQVKAAATVVNGKKVVNVRSIEGTPVQVEVVDGKYAHLSQLKDVYTPSRTTADGKKFRSWFDMDARALGLLPLKQYAFCTDIDAGGDPMCNRFDYGSSPAEVMASRIKDYQDMYPVYNSRNANINIMALPNYISRVLGNMFVIRSFLDEGIFRAIQGAPQANWVPYAQASINGMLMFAEIVGTPTAAVDVMDPSRFSVREFSLRDPANPNNPPQKVKGLVERRALQDMLTPGIDGAVQTRGIEIDKMLALQLLTLEDLGNPRYAQVTLRFSYADFETMLLGSSRGDSLTLNIVRGALSDSVPAIKVVNGQPIGLGNSIKVQVSEAMRFYGILGSIVFLDNTASSDDVNHSRAFLVGKSLGLAPADRHVVTRLGTSLTSPTALKLWAHDTADLAKGLVNTAARARVIIENKGTLGVSLAGVLTAADPAAKATAKAAMVAQLNDLNKNGVLLSPAEATQVTFDAMIDLCEQYISARAGVIGAVEQAIAAGAPMSQLAPQLEAIRNSDEALTKSVPLLSVATFMLNSAMQTDAQKAAAAAVLNLNVLEGSHGTIIGTLEQMNRFITMLHPQLN